MAAVNFPTSPTNGQLFVHEGKVFTWDSTNSIWSRNPTSAGSAEIASSETPPSSPVNGAVWFNTSTMGLYVYYSDGTSSQWVQINDPAGNLGTGVVTVSSSAPSNAVSGDLWYDIDSTGSLLIYDGTYWVTAVPAIGGGGTTELWKNISDDYLSISGDKLLVDSTSESITITLPASPSIGEQIEIVDVTGNAAANNIIIDRNSNLIYGLTNNLSMIVNRSSIRMVYTGATLGWTSVVDQGIISIQSVAAPIVSGINNATEASNITVTISNYDGDAAYIIAVTGGSYTRDGATITWTLPEYDENAEIAYITIQAIKGGLTSQTTAKAVTVEELTAPPSAGISIIITNFAGSAMKGWEQF